MILLLIIIILILIIYLNKNKFSDDTVEEYYNSNRYKVRKGTKVVQVEKAKKLDNLKNKLQKLVNYCKDSNLPTKIDADRMYSRFKNIQFNETASNDSSAAYVVNKDEELRICLNGNENDTMFVLLHELAHIMSKSYGHNTEFKNNMDFLVKQAVKLQIYTPVDYTKSPINYCGVKISTTPCHNNQCLIGTHV